MKRKRMERPARVLDSASRRDDPTKLLTKLQVHQDNAVFDASEISDDRLIPSRPNKYGYFMIVVAVMVLITLVLGFRAGAMDWYATTVTGAFIIFFLVVGVRLIRRSRKLDD